MTKLFDATSTAGEVLASLSLAGKRVLVTSTPVGLGVETAHVLTAHGATVIGAVRDLHKARAATAGITTSQKSWRTLLITAGCGRARSVPSMLARFGQPVKRLSANTSKSASK